jgi:hypothetical protein
MPEQLPDLLTPLTKAQSIEALWRGWLAYFGAPPPSKEALWIVTAQWGLETGWGNHMHNFNMGNVKSKDGDGYDYQFFGCGEEVTLATAQAWKSKDPKLVTFKRFYEAKGKQMASVWIDPPHWVSRFRAFHTAAEGALDHIAILSRRFSTALSAAMAKDPRGYAHELRAAGYYTADEGQYTRGLLGCYKIAQATEVDYDSLPLLTDAQGEALMNLVARTLQDSIDEIFRSERPFDDDAV